MKNQKGFTLAELLGVITLLAIITAITVPIVSNYVASSREKAFNASIVTLKKAAEEWYLANSSSLTFDNNGYYSLKISDLKKTQYLEDNAAVNPINPSEDIPGCIMIRQNNKNVIEYSYSDDCTYSVSQTFSYNGTNSVGTIQTYNVDSDGTYEITAKGAAGTVGNYYGLSSYTATPGQGATVTSDFTLSAGDVLYIVVGGQGSSSNSTSNDGASGAGGGGSFIFKSISSITNANYQFTKNSNNYEVLLVAAGGGGTCDLSFSGSSCSGYSGIGATVYTPSSYTSYSTTTVNPSSGSSNTSVLGISQFISYDLLGNIYTRSTSQCVGGYGGGACADDSSAPGGGWSLSNNAATSFSSGTNTTGTTGSNVGNGTVVITKIS